MSDLPLGQLQEWWLVFSERRHDAQSLVIVMSNDLVSLFRNY